MTPPDQHSPLINPQLNNEILFKLLTAVFLFTTAVSMTIPVRPLLILAASHQNPATASFFSGLVESLQGLLAIFSSPLFGAVSDIIGRKPILIVSHLGELLGLALVAQFPLSLIAQFPAYILIALTNSYVTTTKTIVADISTHSAISSATNYGYLGAVVGASFFIGPTLGGFIEDSFYLASSFHAAVILIIITIIFVYLVVPETLDTDTTTTTTTTDASWRQTALVSVSNITSAISNTDVNPIPRIKSIFLQNEALTWIAVALSLISLAQGGLNTIIFLYTSVRLGWQAKDTGIFLSMLGLSLLISQSILTQVSVRMLGEVRTILLGYSLSAVHYVIYGLAHSTTTMYVGLCVGALSFIAEPTLNGLLARQVGKESQGSLQGSLSALKNVVRPFSPIISTALFGYGTSIGRPGLPFFVIGSFSVIGVVILRIGLWKPGLK